MAGRIDYAPGITYFERKKFGKVDNAVKKDFNGSYRIKKGHLTCFCLPLPAAGAPLAAISRHSLPLAAIL